MNLNDMLQSDEYQAWYSDRMLNLTLHNPERNERCYESAKYGIDGSFHAEVINDWTDFLQYFYRDMISDKEYHEINLEILECWDWHDKGGSLYDEVG